MNLGKDPFTAAQEKAFIAWIRTQPSCLSGDDYNICCAHIRRVSQGAGKARKPRLFGVPMTYDEHQYQTTHGEYAAYLRFSKVTYSKNLSPSAVKAWYEYRAEYYRQKFLESKKRKSA